MELCIAISNTSSKFDIDFVKRYHRHHHLSCHFIFATDFMTHSMKHSVPGQQSFFNRVFRPRPTALFLLAAFPSRGVWRRKMRAESVFAISTVGVGKDAMTRMGSLGAVVEVDLVKQKLVLGVKEFKLAMVCSFVSLLVL